MRRHLRLIFLAFLLAVAPAVHAGQSGLLLGVSSPASAAFTPASVSALAVWIQPDLGGMFQSSTCTGTAATANNDVIGCSPDLSGNGFTLTSAADDTTRPTLQGVGVKPYISFDGANDVLRRLASINGYAGGTQSCFMALRSNSNGTNTNVQVEGNTGITGPIYGLIGAQSTTASTLAATVRNSAGVTALSNVTAVQTGVFNSADHAVGVADNSTSMTPYLDSGTAGTPVAYARNGAASLNVFALGALIRTTTSSWWAGRVYSMACYTTVPTAGEITSLMAYMAARF